LEGTHTIHDWKRLRHEAASSFKVMSQILLMARKNEGKETAPHHFSNEARLVNWALVGEFKGIDRETLSLEDMALLAKLEELNSVLIGSGLSYEKRKETLSNLANRWRVAHTPLLKAA